MRKLGVGGLAFTLVLGCGSSGADPGIGEAGAGAGGMNAGGMNAGGMNAGGMSAGGMNAGGMSAGGMSAGGMSAGGMSTGGMNTGGMNAGGSNTDPNSQAIEEYCIAQTSARCERVFDCRPVEAAQIGTLAECKASTASACATTNFCPISYDPAAGARCITALKTFTCIELTTNPADCTAACP